MRTLTTTREHLLLQRHVHRLLSRFHQDRQARKSSPCRCLPTTTPQVEGRSFHVGRAYAMTGSKVEVFDDRLEYWFYSPNDGKIRMIMWVGYTGGHARMAGDGAPLVWICRGHQLLDRTPHHCFNLFTGMPCPTIIPYRRYCDIDRAELSLAKRCLAFHVTQHLPQHFAQDYSAHGPWGVGQPGNLSFLLCSAEEAERLGRVLGGVLPVLQVR